MTWLTENPTPAVVLGIVVGAILVVVLMQTGRREALYGLVLTVAATIGAVVASFMIVTPREEVISALEELRQLVEKNDRPEIVKRISPSAGELRNRAQSALAYLTIERASIDNLEVHVASDGLTARTRFNGVIVVREGGSRPIPLRFEVDLEKSGEQWLVTFAEYKTRNPTDGGASDEAPMARAFGDAA